MHNKLISVLCARISTTVTRMTDPIRPVHSTYRNSLDTSFYYFWRFLTIFNGFLKNDPDYEFQIDYFIIISCHLSKIVKNS